MIQRTKEGVDAFIDSLNLAPREPERWAFFAAHDTAVVSRIFGWRRTETVASALTLPFLAGRAARARDLPVAVALAAGTVAELARSRDPQQAGPVAAMAASAQHSAYACAMRGTNWPGFATRAITVVAGLGLALAKNNRVALATVAGGFPLAWMASVANAPSTRTPGTSHGANLVFVAEGLNLLRATLVRDRPLVSAAALSMSTVGQMLLADSLTRKKR